MEKRQSEIFNRQLNGFSLDKICWGYRDIFAKTIQSLFDQGLIGEERQEVTSKFFELLKSSDRTGFDHVLKEFICALNQHTRWLMNIPGIFADVVDLGGELAQSKIYYGTVYFQTLGDGGFGSSPSQVRNLMNHLRRIREIDEGLAMAFLKGYHSLVERLEPTEIEKYIDEGVKIFVSNEKAGLGFMEGILKSSENIIKMLTHECRLSEIQPSLENLLRALVGYEVEISDLGELDSDELIERGTGVVCMYKWLYLPSRIRHFDSAEKNRNWYRLIAVVAAGMLSENSFCRIHGHPEYRTCEDLVDTKQLSLNLFQILEYVRILRRIKKRWPGASKLIDFGLETEFSNIPPQTPPDRLFYLLMRQDKKGKSTALSGLLNPRQSVLKMSHLADGSVNVFDTAAKLDGNWITSILEDYPGLDSYPLRTFSFLPDFFYPGEVSVPPKDRLIAVLEQQAKGDNTENRQNKSSADQNRARIDRDDGNDRQDDEEKDEVDGKGMATTSFVYDEWSKPDNDYYRDYCHLREIKPKKSSHHPIPAEIFDDARKVRKVFELLKPDMPKREKHLGDGDLIDSDLLLRYLVQRKMEPSPKVDFYEKTIVNQRDLAVLMLLDVSGSTGERTDQNKVIDVEKKAAVILGQGLNALDDHFAICGFSGNGRENCEYYIYKSFEDDWGQESIDRVLSARPLTSTRIGVALRHSGYHLSKIDAKQRIIILITDGKPMDSNYDANTRYAQYDVRMACEENKRQGIHTFCISTEENSRADMEIMFPDLRFVILPDIRQLPRVLPRLYVKMTT